MAVPKYHEFYNAFLESLQDGSAHAYAECKEYAKAVMKLSAEQLAEVTASGVACWVSRVGWCATYLKKAGLVESPQRSVFQITDAGKELLAEGIQINDKLLSERFPSFAEFKHGGKTSDGKGVIPLVGSFEEETPQDTLERVYQEINAKLADDLTSAVLSMTPQFFERLVVKLMEGMGYGGYEGAGFVTKYSGDGGIDGIINEDKLGFNSIYIQAKRWATDITVGRPEIQKFVGALMGPPKIDKGLFITTAKFSKQAEEYAAAQHIILVDGEKLAKLMIEFGIGVTTEKVYCTKRIDTDFFEED